MVYSVMGMYQLMKHAPIGSGKIPTLSTYIFLPSLYPASGSGYIPYIYISREGILRKSYSDKVRRNKNSRRP